MKHLDSYSLISCLLYGVNCTLSPGRDEICSEGAEGSRSSSAQKCRIFVLGGAGWALLLGTWPPQETLQSPRPTQLQSLLHLHHFSARRIPAQRVGAALASQMNSNGISDSSSQFQYFWPSSTQKRKIRGHTPSARISIELGESIVVVFPVCALELVSGAVRGGPHEHTERMWSCSETARAS